MLYALFFGIIQGICEFFPISSSAHLRLFNHFFFSSQSCLPFFELICNGGTILAATIYLRKTIYKIFTEDKKTFFYLFLAIMPLFPMYIFFKYIQAATYKIELLGFFFIFTSLLLFIAASYDQKKINSSLNRKIKDMLFIGFMQALALIPGISRSGSTISAGCFRGWHIKEAITFSFILAIPTILGGNVLEGFKLYKNTANINNISISSYLIGFFTSFFVGLIAIRFIFSIACKKKLKPFAWYLLVMGILSLIYFNLIV